MFRNQRGMGARRGSRGAGGVAFDPTNISSLQYWWKGGEGLTGDPVTSWLDVVNGGDLVTGTAPAQKTQNGIQVPDFDGTDHLLDSGAAPGEYNLLHNTSEMTICVVCTRDTTSGADGILSTGDDQTGEVGIYLGGTGANNAYVSITTGSGYAAQITTTATPFSDANPHCFMVTKSSGDGVRTYVDGVADGTSALTGASASGHTNALVIGRRTAGRDWDGAICEVMIFNAILSDGDRADLYAWIAARWGI